MKHSRSLQSSTRRNRRKVTRTPVTENNVKNKTPLITLENIAALLMSCGLLVISTPDICLKLTALTSNWQFWAKRVDILSRILKAYGIGMLAIAILGFICSRKGASLLLILKKHSKDTLSAVQEEIMPSIKDSLPSGQIIIWLMFALLTGIAVRGYFLTQPMRYDEAYTFLHFAKNDFLYCFYYPLPNNHVLHTILVRAVTLVFGGHPAVIRIPALLAGIGSIPLIFLLSRKLGASGFFASLAIAVFPYLILYATNARGYTMLVFLTVALTFIGEHCIKAPSAAGSTLFALIASAGMLTMPSMAFPIAGIYGWVVCMLFMHGVTARDTLVKFAMPCGLLTFIFTAILYTPVIAVSNGTHPIVANKYVQPQLWHEFLSQLYPHALETLTDFSRDIPEPVLYICMMLVVVGIYGCIRKRTWDLLMLLPWIVVGSAALFFKTHRIPYTRNWIYLIPFILLLADSGFSYIVEKTPHRIRLAANLIVLIGGLVFAASLISKDAITAYPDTGNFQEAPAAAKYLKAIITAQDKIRVRTPANYPLYYYFWYYGVPEQRAGKRSAKSKEFFIVEKSQYSLKDMTNKPVITLLDTDTMAIYRTAE